jgi:ankyrin repeat protein
MSILTATSPQKQRHARIWLLGSTTALGSILAVVTGGLFYFHWLNSELLRTAGIGDVQAVQTLLNRGASVTARSKAKETPLLLAARRGSLETVHLLLERGADPNARDHFGVTALWWVAARDGTMLNRVALAEVLLQHRADANVHGSINGGATVLHWAAAKGVPGLARTLIQHGADVNAQDQWGGSVLQSAQRAAHNRMTSLVAVRQLVSGLPPEQRSGMLRHIAVDQRKRLDAEETVRILKQAGVAKKSRKSLPGE